MYKSIAKVNPHSVVAIGASFTLAFSTLLPHPVTANPAVVAPLAICSTGVGCLLVGTVVIGAGTYYLWQYGGGKRVVADAAGNIVRMIDNPDESDEIGTWEDPLDTRNEAKAESICKARAKKLGASYSKRRNPATGKWICVFVGGTGK